MSHLYRHLTVLLSVTLTSFDSLRSVSDAEAPADAFVREFTASLPGTWAMEAVTSDGRAVPTGSRVFSPAFGPGNVAAWEDRSLEGTIVARGFLGMVDSLAANVYYVSVAPRSDPVAITGRPDALTRTIVWDLTPATAPEHPYNRGLVVSRMHVLSPTAFDWRAPGHWHIRFRKAP